MRISPLPPLQCLIAFESAARHSSFTRAAAELNLTQSAVSRQIGQLEDFLGRQLFVREPRALQLTVAGQRYADRVRSQLEACSDATFDVMKRYGDLDLAVACSSGVATFGWHRASAIFTPAIPISTCASSFATASRRSRRPSSTWGCITCATHAGRSSTPSR